MKQKPVSSLKDSELFQKILENDQSAWQEIVHRYKDTVYSLLYYILKNPSDVDDAFQNTFLRTKKSATQFRYGENAQKWIKTVASREALQIMRKQNSHNASHVKLNEADTAIDTRSADVDISETEIRDILRREITHLPEMVRTALVLRFGTEMTQEEIASELDSHQRTVSHRIQKGLDLLRQRLAASGITQAHILTPAYLCSVFSDKIPPSNLVRSITSQPAQSQRMPISHGSGLLTIKNVLTGAVLAGAAVAGLFVFNSSRTSEPKKTVSTSVTKPADVKEKDTLNEFFFDFEDGLDKDKWTLTTIQTQKEKIVQFSSQAPSPIRIISSDVFGKPSKVLEFHIDGNEKQAYGIVFKRPVSPDYKTVMKMDVAVIEQPIRFEFMVTMEKTADHQTFYADQSFSNTRGNKVRVEYMPVKTEEPHISTTLFLNNNLNSCNQVYGAEFIPAIFIQKGRFIIDNITVSFIPIDQEED